MTAGEVLAVSVPALAGGGFVAGSLILARPVLRLADALSVAVSKDYAATLSVSVKPPKPEPQTPAAGPESSIEAAP